MLNTVKDRWRMTDVSFNNFRHSPTTINEKPRTVLPQLVTLIDPDESAPSRDVSIFSVSRLQRRIQARCGSDGLCISPRIAGQRQRFQRNRSPVVYVRLVRIFVGDLNSGEDGGVRSTRIKMHDEVAEDKDDRDRNHCRPYLCDDMRRYSQAT
jgi:hypothetical protein